MKKEKKSRIYFCGKCQERMTIAFFVNRHRTKNGAPCRTVPCETCGKALRNDRYRAHGRFVFCTFECQAKHPSFQAIAGGRNDVDSVLESMERADWLPAPYYRAPRTNAG